MNKICLAKREKPAKKRKTGEVQLRLEAAFSKTTNATSNESDDYDNTAFAVTLKAASWLDIVLLI